MSCYYLWVAHAHEQLLLMSCAWACAVITDELLMSMSSYYWWVFHEHKHFLLLSNASAWVVITYELRLSMRNYYWWVGHEHVQLHSRPHSRIVFFLIVERVALGPSKNFFFFIGCRKPVALWDEKCFAPAHLSLLLNTEKYWAIIILSKRNCNLSHWACATGCREIHDIR